MAVVIGAAVLVTAACQSDQKPNLSLEEAKKVTTTFQGRIFVPPPRRVGDIIAILEQETEAESSALVRARALAAEKPPAGLHGEELGRFLWRRSKAAREIGDIRSEWNDLKAANKNLQDADANTRMDLMNDLAVAELLVGSLAESIRLREESMKLIPDGRRGVLLVRNALVSVHYARGGDLLTADRKLGEAENILAEAQGWNGWSEFGNSWTGMVYRAKANILDVRGRYAEALPLYHRAIEAFNADRLTHPDRPFGALILEASHSELAVNLANQDRLAEAEIEARNALAASLARRGRNSSETAVHLQFLIKVISLQGRAADAEALARELIKIYQRIGAPAHSFQLAMARRELAGSLAAQEKWTAALRQFETIRRDLSADADIFERFFAADLTWALALIGSGRADAANDIAEAVYQRRLRVLGNKHYNTAEAQGVHAMALAKLGDNKRAHAAFAEAVQILLTRSRYSEDGSASKAAKSKRLDLILRNYIDLLVNLPGNAPNHDVRQDTIAEAFRMAEVARTQRVQRALNASAARALLQEPTLSDLARREQDARRRISALYGLLLADPTKAASLDLKTRIDDLRAARAVIAEEIAARFPDYADLVNPKPATIEDARSMLQPDEALISTFVAEDFTYVWAIAKNGGFALHKAPLGRQSLGDLVAHIRSTLEPTGDTLGDIRAFPVNAAHELYQALLEPVAKVWRPARNLVVVMHGPLSYLPISMLPTKAVELGPQETPLFIRYRKVPWLARSHAVTYIPSVAALRNLRRLPAAAQDRDAFKGFGDPWFSAEHAVGSHREKANTLKSRTLRLRAVPKTRAVDSAELALLPRLPETADELRSIAAALRVDADKHVFVGAAANEAQVKALDLSRTRVLAFATHGLVPGDLNGLMQPALALSAPNVANVSGDGLLTLDEILALKLDADWVVLSACNTAAADGAGAEAVSGLGRAFFYAGTRALLVSNWPVETSSAKALTTTLFRVQRENPGVSRAEALRRSMLSLTDGPGRIGDGDSTFSYAHPLFWAPFSIYGEPGTRPSS